MQRLKGPEGALLGRNFENPTGRRQSWLVMYRPRSAHSNPGYQISDLLVLQPASEGHFQTFIDLADSPNEQAFFGLARSDRRPGLAALDKSFARIDFQPAHGRGRMARVTAVGQDGTDSIFEEVLRFILLGRAQAVGRPKKSRDKQPQETSSQSTEDVLGHNAHQTSDLSGSIRFESNHAHIL